MGAIVPPPEERRPCRVFAVRSGRIHESSGDRRPRLALGRDADDRQGSEPIRVRHRVLEGGHRAHREADDMERLETEAVDERGEVVDEPVVAKAVRGIPSGAAVAARIRHVDPERLREQRNLGSEVLAAQRRRPVEQHKRRARTVDVVGDVEAAGRDRRHVGKSTRSTSPAGFTMSGRIQSGHARRPPRHSDRARLDG